MSSIIDYILMNSGSFNSTTKWTTAGIGKDPPNQHWWSKKSTSSPSSVDKETSNTDNPKPDDAASTFSETTMVPLRHRQLEQWNARKAEREARLAKERKTSERGDTNERGGAE